MEGLLLMNDVVRFSLNSPMKNGSNIGLISVIIPVYNTSQYLKRCIDSLLSQTYPAIEIMLVDDGSTDTSGSICDEYAESYPNVKCIHKENGGQGSARNEGLSSIHGDYIGFVDSDDWVSPEMYRRFAKVIEETGADVVQTGCLRLTSEREAHLSDIGSVSLYRDKSILERYLHDGMTGGSYSVCTCLFKRAVLEGLTFREGKRNEDIDFKYEALRHAHLYAVIEAQDYFYWQIGSSTTRGGLVKEDFDLYEAARILRDLSSTEGHGIARLGMQKEARTAFSLLSKVAYYGIDDPSIQKKEVVGRFTRELRQNYFLLLSSPMSCLRKVLMTLFVLNYPFAEAMVSVFRKVRV